ncbi:sulfotransferase [Kordiimonas gwangyangensis]|uniref:sulfotransferase n=1 Tax=Kordiimonas gwangyangensis TaxID=288022 RepID=UPI00036D1413|nr:sulfotransferase [Kordiimonas gwangyangensis]
MSKHHFTLGTPNHTGPKTIVIMGVARGGTSLVAGTVREMGINLGARLGENHEDPQFLPTEFDHLRAVIAKRNAELDTWGWKMPHSIDYIADLQHELRNPHFIFVWRNSLAAAISQTKHSDADIYEGIHFAAHRLMHMKEAIDKVEYPSLLINYEQAIADKDGFIDTLAEFLDIQVDDEMRGNCHAFIDPDTGYKQISQTYYEAWRISTRHKLDHLIAPRRLRDLEINDKDLCVDVRGPAPAFIFNVEEEFFPEEFVVHFNNRTQQNSFTKLLFDYDGQFSHNMAAKVDAIPGVNRFQVKTNGKLRRIAVIPSVSEEGIADLRYVQLMQAG